MVFNPFAGGITPRKQQTPTTQTKQKPAATQSALQSFAVPSLSQQKQTTQQPTTSPSRSNLNPFVQAAQQKQQLPSAQGAQGQKTIAADGGAVSLPLVNPFAGRNTANTAATDNLRGQIQQQTQVGSGLIVPPLNPAQIPVSAQKPAEVFQGGAPPVQGNLLEAQEDILRQLIGGSTDTSADEAALRASQKAALDEQMLNSRARAAGLGFGAENALQGDLQTRGNIALETAVSDLRRNARQDDLERALAGIGAISQDRSQDRADAELESDTALNQALLDILQSELGGGPTATTATSQETSENLAREVSQLPTTPQPDGSQYNDPAHPEISGLIYAGSSVDSTGKVVHTYYDPNKNTFVRRGA